MEIVGNYANRTLYLILAPKSRAKVRACGRIRKPPGSLLLTVQMRRFWCYSYLMFIGVCVPCRFRVLLLGIYMLAVADRLPRLGKRELIFLLSFTCNYVVSVMRGSFSSWDGLCYFILTLPVPSIYLFCIGHMTKLASMTIYEQNIILFRLVEFLFRLHGLLFRFLEILFRLPELLFRFLDILFRLDGLLIRFLEILFRLHGLLIRFLEILFRLHGLLIRFHEILVCLHGLLIRFQRSYFVCTDYKSVFTRSYSVCTGN